ncbi:MAG: RidA family protein [Candidatus Kariarchaeaceae archaeon]|jgi:enamine deaminase RidA (YjgF/YER057c/UK114 family)
MYRENYASGSPWEEKYGYSRAVRIGDFVHVSGTTGTDETGKVVSHDPYEQTKYSLEKIALVLGNADSSMKNVYRVRLYLVDENDTEVILRAYSEVFKLIKPTATLVIVKGLMSEDMVVEIEVEAIINKLDSN